MQFEDIGWGRDLAAREWVVWDLATSGETDVAKDVAFGAFEAEVLVSIKYRKCLYHERETEVMTLHGYTSIVYHRRINSAINDNV